MNAAGRWIVPLAVMAVVAYFLFLVRGILLPFILAATLAYLLSPAVDFFVVHGLRRLVVVVGIYSALLLALTGGLYLGTVVVTQEAAKAALKMPEYVAKGERAFERLVEAGRPNSRSPFATDHPVISQLARHSDVMGSVLSKAKSWPTDILQHMPSIASHVLPLLELAFLVPFICFFLMMEGPRMIDQIFQWIPARYVEMSLNMLVEVDYSLGNYLRGISLEALVVGLTAFAGFWVIDLDYALQIALVVGLGNMIPYVGPVLGAILGGTVALFQWGTIAGVLKVWLVCAIVRFIEDWFFQPLILKRAIHLHPVLIVFSLMAGTTLWGFWGLLFGVPVACMAKVLLQVVAQWYRSEYGFRDSVRPEAVSHIPIV